MLAQDAQEKSVKTADSYLLKMLNTTDSYVLQMLNKTSKINIRMKKIVFHVIKIQQHGIKVTYKNLWLAEHIPFETRLKLTMM